MQFFRCLATFLIMICIVQPLFSQDLYIDSGGEFYLMSNTDFTTSNTIVSLDNSGKFSVEAGSDWGSALEYVDGSVTAYGTGETILPVGNNGVYLPVTAKHTGTVTAAYMNATPTSGSNGLDVDDVSDIEYWELTGKAVITLPWNEDSDITSLVNDNGGDINSVTIVGLNSGNWELVSDPGTNVITGDLLNGDVTSDENVEVTLNGFDQFTFGIVNQTALAVEDFFLVTGIQLVSNPVGVTQSDIQFRSSEELYDLNVDLYDIMGRRIQSFKNVKTYNGLGNLKKPNLRSGIYLLKFDYEGKQGVKKIIIE